MNKFLDKKYNYDKHKEKGVMFFSVASPKDAHLVMDSGINEILVSYFYLRKRKKVFEQEIIPRIRENNGLFMTDSGGFSFIQGKRGEEMGTPDFWQEYLEEYVSWVHEWSPDIFVAANLDLDNIVGRDVVDSWNEEWFEPLERRTNIVYVSHKDETQSQFDKHGLNRLKDYCSRYKYVGVNQKYKNQANKVYEIARATKTRIHGFAWTSVPLLKSRPLFSVDSSTWSGGARFGTTYVYDGKNFKVIDYKNKHIRNSLKHKVTMNEDVDFDALLKSEKGHLVNRLNLNGWKGARREYLVTAKCKLANKPVSFYEHS